MSRKPRYVKLTLHGEVVEGRTELPFFGHHQVAFPWIVRVLEAARRRTRVKALFLVLKDVHLGWEQIQEIHRELDRFHAAGGRSVACLEHADNKTYYLACGAQRIYIPPSITLDLIGLRVEIFFFKNLLDFLGIEPQLFALGEYKTAAEILTRENMSEANRTMLESILTNLQSQFIDKIAAARHSDRQKIQSWIDEGPYTARQALEKGLVDGVCYEDEAEALLQEGEPKLSRLAATDLPIRETFLKRLLTVYRPQIAYLVAEGIISSGESRRRGGKYPILGSHTLSRFLQQARKRKRVKALVIRINSPGGSAVASDLLWRQIRLTAQEKPVVISFGDVAASGGYYLATATSTVMAMPATLTGSIGVIQGKFNVSRLLSKLGVTVNWIEKGRRAGYASLTRSFTPEEAETVQNQMRNFYEEMFLKKVAESRNKSMEEVRQVGEGRVWTGRQALDQGLLDQIGGFLDAIEIARQKAGLAPEKKVRIVEYIRRPTLRDLIAAPLPAFRENEMLALMPDLWEIR